MIDRFEKVLLLLTNFEDIERLIKISSRFTSNKTVLEILYVHQNTLFELPDLFLSSNRAVDKSAIKREIKSRVQKDAAIFVYIDDVVDRVLNLTKEQNNLLIISAYHKNITKKIVKNSTNSFFILKKDKENYKNIIIPTDLTPNSKPCINLSKKLFQDSKIKLLYDLKFLLSDELKTTLEDRYEELKKEVNLDGYMIKESFINEVEFIEEEYLIQNHISEFINDGFFDLTIFCLENFYIELVESLKCDMIIIK